VAQQGDAVDRLQALKAAAAKSPSLAGRGLIRAYRYTLSSIMGRTCRHLPTCSEYGDEALGRHGLWAGGWMTLGRVARCHPWGTSGLDLVPSELPRHSRWYLPWRYARWRGINDKP
jgi:putative membrane protein insertion efficiency factor